jgi:DNA-binding NarL/FixJ family response regulator
MTFLIAEDNSHMRESIKRFLLTRVPDHHTVFEASDGREAIEMYRRVTPDWVLMDIAMDPVDGLVASRVIRAAHPDAKIIILTNYDDPGYRKAAKDAGTIAFVVKEHLGELVPILLPSTSGGLA